VNDEEMMIGNESTREELGMKENVSLDASSVSKTSEIGKKVGKSSKVVAIFCVNTGHSLRRFSSITNHRELSESADKTPKKREYRSTRCTMKHSLVNYPKQS
jgi:hypothetical protein